MTTTFKIAVAGTHSTGKSTFVAELDAVLRAAGYAGAVVGDVADEAYVQGLPILREQTAESTLWIMTRAISLELEAGQHADIVIADRPVSDALGYYLTALAHRREPAPACWTDYLRKLVSSHLATYNLIFRTVLDPLIPLDTSKLRDPDLTYRSTVQDAITQVLDDLRVRHRPLYTGRSTQAVRVVLEHLARRRP